MRLPNYRDVFDLMKDDDEVRGKSGRMLSPGGKTLLYDRRLAHLGRCNILSDTQSQSRGYFSEWHGAHVNDGQVLQLDLQ